MFTKVALQEICRKLIYAYSSTNDVILFYIFTFSASDVIEHMF